MLLEAHFQSILAQPSSSPPLSSLTDLTVTASSCTTAQMNTNCSYCMEQEETAMGGRLNTVIRSFYSLSYNKNQYDQ